MKLGSVIGRVTLNSVVPELRGARWLVISPFTRERFAAGAAAPGTVSAELNLVAYDCLGAAAGQTVGYVEGREAAQPFAVSPPIDAIVTALVDEIFYCPFTK